MSSINCAIFFDQNEHGTYYAGQVVTGRVLITTTKPKKFKGIKLQFCGYAACQWRDRGGKYYPIENTAKKKKKRHAFYAHEDYIASSQFLVGSEEGQPFSYETGTNTYTFACPIPYNCPSSFEGGFGHIRYLTRVTFYRAGSSDRTFNVGFTVLKIVNLNQESPLLRAPINNEARESFCFVSTASVHLRIDLHQSGYVPGEYVLVSVDVNNQSSVDCRKTLILLILRATYTADTPRLCAATEKITLVKRVCGPVAKYSQKQFGDSFRIPATPPTCESISKIVRVSYEITVIAAMNHFMVNPKATIPITIGNVPLTPAEDAPAHPQRPLPSVVSTQVPIDEGPSTSARAIQQSAAAEDELGSGEESETDDEFEGAVPPPSYEEAMYMTRDIADVDGNVESDAVRFTPRYPVYNVNGVQDPQQQSAGQNQNVYVGGGVTAAEATAAPNLPEKKARKKKKQAPAPFPEKPPMESPVQI